MKYNLKQALDVIPVLRRNDSISHRVSLGKRT